MFLEKCKAQDLQYCVEIGTEIESFLDDRDQNINGNCDPYLSLHRIFGGAEKGFDAQVLFDPFEKQFDLPAVTIQVGNCLGRYSEVVAQEVECLAGVLVVILDTAKRLRVVGRGIHARQHNGLVAYHASRFVHQLGIATLVLGIGFGANNEEGTRKL